ncbi:MAG: OmpA family protein [Pirellulaceae bacterium]
MQTDLRTRQLPSKYLQRGMEVLDRSLIAQVHFAYNERELDQNDKRTLDSLIDIHRLALSRPPSTNWSVRFQIVGHADSRGKAAGNQRLALHRAQAVEKYIDQRLVSKHCFTDSTSNGELNATGNHAFDRRVDIYRIIQAREDKPIQVPVPKKVRASPPNYKQIGFWATGLTVDLAFYKYMRLYLNARINDDSHSIYRWFASVHAGGASIPRTAPFSDFASGERIYYFNPTEFDPLQQIRNRKVSVLTFGDKLVIQFLFCIPRGKDAAHSPWLDENKQALTGLLRIPLALPLESMFTGGHLGDGRFDSGTWGYAKKQMLPKYI